MREQAKIHRSAIQELQVEIARVKAHKWGEIRTTMDLLYNIDKRIAQLEKEGKSGLP